MPFCPVPFGRKRRKTMQVLENLKVKEKVYTEKLKNGLTVMIIPKTKYNGTADAIPRCAKAAMLKPYITSQ